MSLAQNHEDNVFVAVTLSPTSALYDNPEGLTIHPLIKHHGLVGELHDVQLLSIPRNRWTDAEGEVLDLLNGLPGVLRVDVQDLPRRRAKRGGDEL